MIQISVREGRSPERIRELVSAVTHATATSLDVPLGSVRVIVSEIPATHWANGDVTLAEKSHAAERS